MIFNKNSACAPEHDSVITEIFCPNCCSRISVRKKATPAAFPLWYEEAMLAEKVKEIIAKVQERTEVMKAQV